MTQAASQLQDLQDLDARVDALIKDIDVTRNKVQKSIAETGVDVGGNGADPGTAPNAAQSPEPVPALPKATDPGLDFDDSMFESADAVLASVSDDIEETTPGPIAEPQLQAPMPASAESASAQTDLRAAEASLIAPMSGPAAQTMADVASTLDETLAASADDHAEAVSTAATVPSTTPAPAIAPVETAPSASETTESSGSPDSEFVSPEEHIAQLEAASQQPPTVDIERLDRALAANAEKALAEAQREIENQPAEQPQPQPAAASAPESSAATAEPVVVAAAGVASTPAANQPGSATPIPASGAPSAATQPAPAPTPAPAAPSASKPNVAAAAAEAVAPAPAAAAVAEPVAPAEPPKPAVPLRERLRPITTKLGAIGRIAISPLVQIHAKFNEQTRQTIAYIAIMNVFFASVVWFFALRPKPEPEVVSDARQFFASEIDAKKAAEEAAKEAKAKAEEEAKKSGSSHGKSGDGHGDAKKPAAKKPEPKKEAKPKADGGH